MLVLGQVDPIPEITPGQHSFEDIRLRAEALQLERRRAFWDRIQTAATASLAALALTGVVYALVQGRGLTEAIKRGR